MAARSHMRSACCDSHAEPVARRHLEPGRVELVYRCRECRQTYAVRAMSAPHSLVIHQRAQAARNAQLDLSKMAEQVERFVAQLNADVITAETFAAPPPDQR